MFRQMMGFNRTPLCIIWWQVNGERKSKTVCYTDDDKKWALERFQTPGDFYSRYDKAVVDYGDGIIEYGHLERKGA